MPTTRPFGYWFIADKWPSRSIATGENRVARLRSQERNDEPPSRPIISGDEAASASGHTARRTWLAAGIDYSLRRARLSLHEVADILPELVVPEAVTDRTRWTVVPGDMI